MDLRLIDCLSTKEHPSRAEQLADTFKQSRRTALWSSPGEEGHLGSCAHPTQAASLDVPGTANINVPTPHTQQPACVPGSSWQLWAHHTQTHCFSSPTNSPGHCSHALRQFPLNIWLLQSTPLSPNEDWFGGDVRPKRRGQQGGDVWHTVTEQARQPGLQQGGWQSISHPDPHALQREEGWALQGSQSLWGTDLNIPFLCWAPSCVSTAFTSRISPLSPFCSCLPYTSCCLPPFPHPGFAPAAQRGGLVSWWRERGLWRERAPGNSLLEESPFHARAV